MLVLLTRRIYDTCRSDDIRWHNIYIPSFITIDPGIRVILTVSEAVVLVLLISLVRPRHGIRGLDILVHTNPQDDRFRNSSNIKGIISKKLERL
jgi:hypothetical protein